MKLRIRKVEMLLACCIVVLIVLISYFATKSNNKELVDAAIQADEINIANDIIADSAVDMQEKEVSLTESSMLRSMAPMTVMASIEDGNLDVSEIETDTVDNIDPYTIVVNDIEKLKKADPETVKKYFGNSDIFTPETVADKITASIVSFVSSSETEHGTEVIVHICTLDYDKMLAKSNELKQQVTEEPSENGDIKTEIAKGVVNNEFDIHYNIPLIVENGEVKATEEFKQAITGNWYDGIGIELSPVECILNQQ